MKEKGEKMKTKNYETKDNGNERELYVCSICGKMHPKRFMQMRRGRKGYICCSCAYECYASCYRQVNVNPEPYLASLITRNLSKTEAKRIAEQFNRNLKANYMMLNEFDDFHNVSESMVKHYKEGYQGAIEQLYETVCEEVSRRKFERKCNYYFDMEALFEMYGEVNYDNFEVVFLPSTQNPSAVLKMFKLVQLDRTEVLASVNYLLTTA